MVKNGKNRFEVVLLDESLEILDRRKQEWGYGSRSDAVRHLIHRSDRVEPIKFLDINTMLLCMTMVFGVGFLRNNVYLQMMPFVCLVLGVPIFYFYRGKFLG